VVMPTAASEVEIGRRSMPDESKLKGMREPDLTSRAEEQRVRRPAERGERAESRSRCPSVALPCCRLSKVARWNGQAPQMTTTQ
jgi:hypothetical protein